ncbi:MAG: ParB/RepB/Spo0J family partition protein [Microcystaceae cyanobacterium]
MSYPQNTNLDHLFFGAEQAYQLKQAEIEIEQLKTEIEQLRGQDGEEIENSLNHLRTHLTQQSGMMTVPLEQIEPNPHQPRRTFLPESIDAIAQSLHQEGQLQPIILMEREVGKYLLFDGERRWRGAKQLKWETLEAVIIPPPQALHRQVLIAALHREDLNALDKAEAIVTEIVQTTQIDPQDIPRLLCAVCRRLTKQKKLKVLSGVVTASVEQQQQTLQTLILNPSEQSMLSVILALQLNPASVDANLFAILSLERDLKAAIRTQGLKGSQALLLQRLSAKNLHLTPQQAQEIRTSATTEVINKRLSVTRTRQLVKQLQQQYDPSSDTKTHQSDVSLITTKVKQLSKTQLEQVETSHLESLEQLLQQKLGEITEVLQSRQPNDN